MAEGRWRVKPDPRLCRPLLAMKCPKGTSFEDYLSALKFPLIGTPKIDGIRCRTDANLALPPGFQSWASSRSGKEIPNNHVRSSIQELCPPWMDGELATGVDFSGAQSGIMTHEGQPNFTYWVFDYMWHLQMDYQERIGEMVNASQSWPIFVKPLTGRWLKNLEELLAYETECLGNNAEGVMVRPPDSPYVVGSKDNRASKTRPYLIAIKRFDDGEAVVSEVVEMEGNENPVVQDNRGDNYRQSFIAGMVPRGTMGALIVRDRETGKEFRIGTGFTAAERREIWDQRYVLGGKTLKYKWQAHGTKDKPRIPVFLGWRSEEDMS